MQLLAKFKRILYMGFRATLNFRKFKVALNPMYRTFLNFAKSCTSSYLSKFCNKKKFHRALFFKYERLKQKGNLSCHENNTSSPMTGQFFDTIIVASIDKEWL